MGNLPVAKDIGKVVITVRGGCAEVVEQSDNVSVEIRDYDIEGVEEARLTEDDEGKLCIVSTY